MLGTFYTDSSFKAITTLKCGGKIALLYYPNSIRSFAMFMEYINKLCIRYFIIGNGSNILASDEYFDGIVISFKKMKERIYFNYINEKVLVTCHSGISAPVLSKILCDKFITGGEALSTIPGSIGGLVTMNASCYDFKTQDYLNRCLIYTKEGIRWYKNYELDFSYRNSLIKENNSDYIILACEFIFEKGKVENIIKKINKYKENRKETQPITFASAGSVFKNKNGINAWKLIDECGLRGYTFNNVKVSEKHANFIVNLGDCKSIDVLKLINYIKNKVRNEKNIILEEEWIIFNFKDADFEINGNV